MPRFALTEVELPQPAPNILGHLKSPVRFSQPDPTPDDGALAKHANSAKGGELDVGSLFVSGWSCAGCAQRFESCTTIRHTQLNSVPIDFCDYLDRGSGGAEAQYCNRQVIRLPRVRELKTALRASFDDTTEGSWKLSPKVEVRTIMDPAHPLGALPHDKMRPLGLFVKDGCTVSKGEVLGEFAGEIIEFVDSASSEALRLDQFRVRFDEPVTDPRRPEETLDLVVCADKTRNELACINDHRVLRREGMVSDPATRRCNVVDRTELVGGWPHVVVEASAKIPSGAEVLTDFGREYWTPARVQELREVTAQRTEDSGAVERSPADFFCGGCVEKRVGEKGVKGRGCRAWLTVECVLCALAARSGRTSGATRIKAGPLVPHTVSVEAADKLRTRGIYVPVTRAVFAHSDCVAGLKQSNLASAAAIAALETALDRECHGCNATGASFRVATHQVVDAARAVKKKRRKNKGGLDTMVRRTSRPRKSNEAAETMILVEHHYHAWCHANANTPIAAATPSCVKAEPLSQQHGTRIDPMDELGADEGAWDGANVTEVEMELEEVATSQPDDDDEDGTEENELVGTLRTLTKQASSGRARPAAATPTRRPSPTSGSTPATPATPTSPAAPTDRKRKGAPSPTHPVAGAAAAAAVAPSPPPEEVQVLDDSPDENETPAGNDASVDGDGDGMDEGGDAMDEPEGQAMDMDTDRSASSAAASSPQPSSPTSFPSSTDPASTASSAKPSASKRRRVSIDPSVPTHPEAATGSATPTQTQPSAGTLPPSGVMATLNPASDSPSVLTSSSADSPASGQMATGQSKPPTSASSSRGQASQTSASSPHSPSPRGSHSRSARTAASASAHHSGESQPERQRRSLSSVFTAGQREEAEHLGSGIDDPPSDGVSASDGRHSHPHGGSGLGGSVLGPGEIAALRGLIVRRGTASEGSAAIRDDPLSLEELAELKRIAAAETARLLTPEQLEHAREVLAVVQHHDVEAEVKRRRLWDMLEQIVARGWRKSFAHRPEVDDAHVRAFLEEVDAFKSTINFKSQREWHLHMASLAK